MTENELTKEDCMNIRQWAYARWFMLETESPQEQLTLNKIKHIQEKLEKEDSP